jgi:hypothetical protein
MASDTLFQLALANKKTKTKRENKLTKIKTVMGVNINTNALMPMTIL